MSIVSTGSPVTCSTFTLAAPAVLSRSAPIFVASRTFTSNSSPYTLTATSLRTPPYQLVEAQLDGLADFAGLPGSVSRTFSMARASCSCFFLPSSIARGATASRTYRRCSVPSDRWPPRRCRCGRRCLDLSGKASSCLLQLRLQLEARRQADRRNPRRLNGERALGQLGGELGAQLATAAATTRSPPAASKRDGPMAEAHSRAQARSLALMAWKRKEGALFLRDLPPRKSATRAGMKVIDRTVALPRASTTVSAIGLNIFPSMPVSARIGRYTTVMMTTPTSEALSTSCEASSASRRRSLGPDLPLAPLATAASGGAVLDDDHGAVDDEAEVDRAEAHQVSADVEAHHPAHGDQHGERDSERGDQRSPEVAEHEEQDDDDERGALEQALQHRVQRRVDEVGAVVDSLRFTPSGRIRSTRASFVVHAARDVAAVPAEDHDCRADYDLPAVLGRRARAELAADPALGQSSTRIGTPSWLPSMISRMSSSLSTRPGRADEVLLPAVLDVAAARVGVVGGERLGDVAKREPVPEQPRRDPAPPGNPLAWPPIELTSVTPGTLRSCGRTTQSCSARRSPRSQGGRRESRLRRRFRASTWDLAEARGDGPIVARRPAGRLSFFLRSR